MCREAACFGLAFSRVVCWVIGDATLMMGCKPEQGWAPEQSISEQATRVHITGKAVVYLAYCFCACRWVWRLGYGMEGVRRESRVLVAGSDLIGSTFPDIPEAKNCL